VSGYATRQKNTKKRTALKQLFRAGQAAAVETLKNAYYFFCDFLKKNFYFNPQGGFFQILGRALRGHPRVSARILSFLGKNKDFLCQKRKKKF
jgi:hypothetical protein